MRVLARMSFSQAVDAAAGGSGSYLYLNVSGLIGLYTGINGYSSTRKGVASPVPGYVESGTATITQAPTNDDRWWCISADGRSYEMLSGGSGLASPPAVSTMNQRASGSDLAAGAARTVTTDYQTGFYMLRAAATLAYTVTVTDLIVQSIH